MSLPSLRQRIIKRLFDICLSFLGLIITSWIIIPACLLAAIDTKRNCFFVQKRIGYRGKSFYLIKLRTMRPDRNINTFVTTAGDPRITKIGRLFRKTKIDELPQLINVLLGQMSFVGPRPDVPGFADKLQGEDRVILEVRPGITGPATLKFRDEEKILAKQDDPENYNNEVIFPEKVKLNKDYVRNYSFYKDLKYIWQTIFGLSSYHYN